MQDEGDRAYRGFVSRRARNGARMLRSHLLYFPAFAEMFRLLVLLFVVTVLEREREETKEAESSVAAFRRQVASQQEAVAALDAEIEQYRARVANLRKGPFQSMCSAHTDL